MGDVWLNTSHAYLKSITAETNRAKHDLDMSQNHDSEYTYYAEQTLWKARTQYRNIVKEDVAFYKDLINRVVRFYNIQDLVEHTLGLIGIPVSHEPSEDGRLPADFTDVERQDTLHMVYEAVTHLGDLERYLSSLDNVELAPNGRPDPNAPFAERDYKSEDYYQTAITLDPDSGKSILVLPRWKLTGQVTLLMRSPMYINPGRNNSKPPTTFSEPYVFDARSGTLTRLYESWLLSGSVAGPDQVRLAAGRTLSPICT